jgi:hypothetical protein
MLILFYPIPILLLLFVVLLIAGEVQFKARNIVNLSIVVLALYLFVLIPFVFLSFKEQEVRDFYICECLRFEGDRCTQFARVDLDMLKENDTSIGVCGTLEPVDKFRKVFWGDRRSFTVRVYYQTGKFAIFPQDVIRPGSFFLTLTEFVV